MFKNWKRQVRNVPSWQYKNNLIKSSITFGSFVILFVFNAIYNFVKYGNSIWWAGFIMLALVAVITPIYVFLIKWLWERYKTALSIEQQEQDNKHSLQEENEALKREI